MRRRRKNRGFTLIELVVVMTILVLLAGTAAVIVLKRIEDGRRTKAIADIAAMENALKLYNADCSEYPTTEQGLQSLREKPTDAPAGWNGPYMEKGIPVDPWGEPYHYTSPGDHNTEGYDLWSTGKDRKDGGEGNNADLTNWEESSS